MDSESGFGVVGGGSAGARELVGANRWVQGGALGACCIVAGSGP